MHTAEEGRLDEYFRTGLQEGRPKPASHPARPRAIQRWDRAVEAWLQSEVAEAYDALVADPLRGVSADELRARLASKRAAAQ